jgi:hypothetical protein
MAGHREASMAQHSPTRVFVSATSKDLGSVRELVKQALLTMGCMPVEQTNFSPDYRSVREMLEQRIAGCEAMIHLVGMQYGAEPDPASLPEGAVRRSYTQLEAEIARKLGKKLYVFICPEDFPYDTPREPEELEFQTLQRAYRENLAKGERLRTHVADREDIARKVRELQFELEKLRRGIGRDRRRVMILLAALVMALGAVGTGLWYWVPRVVEEKVAYDREKARAQLETDIRKQAGEKIEEAGDDWRQVNEIEKWRDHQLADLDRFLDRIEETFESGEATESYRKAAELLESKGVDEALAYLQAESTKRKESIELQIARRDREESDLRKLLQEDLLEASPLESKFEFEEAEAKYRSVVENARN